MSRRKQSNPKPLKRQSESEDNEDGIDDKLTSTEEDSLEGVPNGQINTIKQECLSPSNESNDVFDRKGTKTPNSVTGEEECGNNPETVRITKESSVSPTEIEFLKSLSFPNDVLFLKKVDEEDISVIGRVYLVCASIPLQTGSSIGPFRGEQVSLSSIRQGDLVLQAHCENGDANFVRVLERNGAWLSLLRPATSEAQRNASVFFEGDRIWCQIMKDVEVGTEIVASFSVVPVKEDADTEMEHLSETDNGAKSPISKENGESESVTSSPPVASASCATSPTSSKSRVNHAALLYGCPFCGVRFSSARTLDGHLTYYCSKKPPDFPSGTKLESPSPEARAESPIEKQDRKRKNASTPDIHNSGHLKIEPASPASERDLESPPSKYAKSEENFKCPFCSYSADKMSSLNRHMRIHNRGGKHATEQLRTNNLTHEQLQLLTSISKFETYCKECNIQFSSANTYKCHKDYYCSRGPKTADEAADTDKNICSNIAFRSPFSGSPLLDAAAGKFDIKSFMASSSFLQGQTRVIVAPPIVSSDSDHDVPTVIVQPVLSSVPVTETATRPSEDLVIPTKQIKEHTKSSSTSEQPLDLSTHKKPVVSQNSPNRRHESIHVKQEPLSPTTSLSSLKSPSSHASESPRLSQSRETTPNSASSIISPGLVPAALAHQIPFFGPGKSLPAVVSKCLDCNIVFYKHENYMIHKKHYCSSRRSRSSPSNSSEDSNGMVSVTMSPKGLQTQEIKPDRNCPSETDLSEKDSVFIQSPAIPNPKLEKARASDENTAVSVPEDILYRFYCIPCKIKFSSSSTLNAHKKYYCPHGQEEQVSPKSKRHLADHGSSNQDEQLGIFKCDRCESTFVSARLLKLHICTGASGSSPLMRCPYCEFVTQTDVRISDHMKVHMPSKAYRCTLCGYRGNTVRGMRMHGKMHVDSGQEFTDDNMIEIEEPPLLPVKTMSVSENGPIDMEAELIRLKNEPYKRRRSRKAYEKSEFMVMPAAERAPSNVCSLCGQSFADLGSFAFHIRLHEMVALQAMSPKKLQCQHCEEVCDKFDDLMKHLQVKHREKLSPSEAVQLSEYPKAESRSSDRSSVTSPKISRPNSANSIKSSLSENHKLDEVNKKLPVKIEPKDSSYNEETRLTNGYKVKEEPLNFTSDSASDRCSSRSTSCSANDSAVPKVQDENMNNSSSPEHGRDSVLSQVSDKQGSQHSKSPNTKSQSPVTMKTPPNFKNISPKQENLLSPLSNIPDSTSMMPFYRLLPGVGPMPQMVSLTPPLPGHSSSTLSKINGDEMASGRKYCKHCDISFTYLATFVAHKKYYCSAKSLEGSSSPTHA